MIPIPDKHSWAVVYIPGTDKPPKGDPEEEPVGYRKYDGDRFEICPQVNIILIRIF